MKVFAIPPESSCEYLTPGKRYEVIEPDPDLLGGYMIADRDIGIYIAFAESSHINGKSFIVEIEE